MQKRIALIALYKSHRPNDSFADLAAVIAGDKSASPRRTSSPSASSHRARRRPISTTSTGAHPCATASCVDALHGAAVRVRSPRQDLVHDRRRFRPAALATAMSSAWVAFARTGNPGHQASLRGPRSTRQPGPRWFSARESHWSTTRTARSARRSTPCARDDSAGQTRSSCRRGGKAANLKEPVASSSPSVRACGANEIRAVFQTS